MLLLRRRHGDLKNWPRGNSFRIKFKLNQLVYFLFFILFLLFDNVIIRFLRLRSNNTFFRIERFPGCFHCRFHCRFPYRLEDKRKMLLVMILYKRQISGGWNFRNCFRCNIRYRGHSLYHFHRSSFFVARSPSAFLFSGYFHICRTVFFN